MIDLYSISVVNTNIKFNDRNKIGEKLCATSVYTYKISPTNWCISLFNGKVVLLIYIQTFLF